MAILRVSITKGVNTSNRQTFVTILLGQFLTPIVVCFFALVIHFAAHLPY
jgi:hypothetical protein